MPPIIGFATTSFSHRSEGHVAVIAHGRDGAWDLLVYEVCRYAGEVLLPHGTVVLEVTADGSWTGRLSRAGR